MSGKKSVWGLGALRVAVSIGCGTANAQTLRLRILFNFNVADQEMPAGEYALRQLNTTQAVLQMQRLDDGPTVNIQTRPIYTKDYPSNGKLVFNNYGGQRFLAEIWWADSTIGRSTYTSDAEQLIAANTDRTRTELVLRR